MLKIATLFSGIGAIEQALKQMNIKHKIIFACDNGERELELTKEEILENIKNLSDEEKKDYIERLYESTNKENLVEQSYKRNYKIDNNHFYQDVRFLCAKKYENQIDLLVGGSPCQAFSVNGKRGGFEDTRGTLFYEYARIIKECKPKTFIFENVKGMITHNNGNTWEIIKNVFNELDYDIYIKKDEKGNEAPILNAADYGIPQNRLRLFVIGFRKDLKINEKFEFPKKIELTTQVKDYLEKNVDAKYYLGKKGFEFVTTHPSRAQVGGKIMRCQKAIQQFNWNGDFIFESLKEINKKPNKDQILSRAYIGTWKNERGVIRKFTPRECLRLMGFKDDFIMLHNDTTMYRQSGNSIVVNVLKELVNQIIKTGAWNEC